MNYTHPNETDFKRNGMYCESGLAYPSNDDTAYCTSFKEMMFNNTIIDQPFNCSPRDQSIACQSYFDLYGSDTNTSDYFNPPQIANSTRLFVKNQCKCGLDGKPGQGWCSSMIGTKDYSTAVLAVAALMSQSGCHTKDRNDMRA